MKRSLILISISLFSLIQVIAQGSRPLEYLEFDVWPTLTQAQELRGHGRFDEAIALLTEAIRTNQQNGYLFLQRALCHLEKKDGEPILQDLKKAAALVPNEYIVHNGVSMLQMNGQDNDALDLIDDFLSKKDDSESSYFLRSQLRLERGDFKGAFDDSIHSLRLEPFLDNSRVDQLLKVLEKLRTQQSATDQYAETIDFLDLRCRQFETKEYWKPYALLMSNYVIQSAPTRCNETLRKVITDNIVLLDKKSDLVAVQLMLDKLVLTQPEIKALTVRSEIQVLRTRYFEAIDDLTKALQISGQTKHERAALLLRRSKVYSLALLPEKAAADSAQAYLLDPSLKSRRPLK